MTRLVEVALVELRRRGALRANQESIGLLAGLGKSITDRAMFAMHADIARGWTVAWLARTLSVLLHEATVRSPSHFQRQKDKS